MLRRDAEKGAEADGALLSSRLGAGSPAAWRQGWADKEEWEQAGWPDGPLNRDTPLPSSA